MANGGPAVRCRTAAEHLPGTTAEELARLAGDVLDSPLVAEWLQRLALRTGLNRVHSAYPDSFENVMGKLSQLGCRAGMRPLDERTAAHREWLARELEKPARDVMGGFVRIDVGTVLAVAGYARDPAVAEYLDHRLERCMGSRSAVGMACTRRQTHTRGSRPHFAAGQCSGPSFLRMAIGTCR